MNNPNPALPLEAVIKETTKEFAKYEKKQAEAPTTNVPDGVKSVQWFPLEQDGITFYQCFVEGFGVRGFGSSRSKMQALAYSLRDVADQVEKMPALP